MKLQMQRQLFGLHMPMRILMERKIVSQVCVPTPISPFTFVVPPPFVPPPQTRAEH